MTETICSILTIVLLAVLLIWELSLRFRIFKLMFKFFRKLNK
jgi:hypothetical protein